MIQHTRGNAISLFIDDESKCAFAHGANCLCRMERQTGIAYEVKVRLPELWEADQRTKPGDRDKLGTASLVTWFGFDGEIQHIGYNLYTQYSNLDESDMFNYEALRTCFRRLRSHMIRNDIPKVYIPKIGAGLAKGDWSKILKIIEEETADITVVVVEYDPGA